MRVVVSGFYGNFRCVVKGLFLRNREDALGFRRASVLKREGRGEKSEGLQ